MSTTTDIYHDDLAALLAGSPAVLSPELRLSRAISICHPFERRRDAQLAKRLDADTLSYDDRALKRSLAIAWS
jgi:hypothetical protein